MVGPSFSPGAVGMWERAGVATFTALAGIPGTGVTMRRGRLASRRLSQPLPGLDPCPADEHPEGFSVAILDRIISYWSLIVVGLVVFLTSKIR